MYELFIISLCGEMFAINEYQVGSTAGFMSMVTAVSSLEKD